MKALLKFKGCTYYVIAERMGLGALHLITVLNMGGGLSKWLQFFLWGAAGPQRLELEPILPDNATNCEAGGCDAGG